MTQSPSPVVDEVADLPPWTETEAWLVRYIADLKQTPNRFAEEIRELEIVLKRLRAAALLSPPKAGAGEPVARVERTDGPDRLFWLRPCPPKGTLLYTQQTSEDWSEKESPASIGRYYKSPGLQKAIDDTKGKIREAFRETATQQPRGDGVRVTDEMVERASRAWCRAYDIDPDLPHGLTAGAGPWWKVEAKAMRAALEAALADYTPDETQAALIDRDRMDWLVSQYVEVRTPLVYGSRALFVAQTLSDEGDAERRTYLREQIDAARAALAEESNK